MSFAPLSDPLHVDSVAEVFSIAWLAQPAPLTVGLAGLAAIRCATEQLSAKIMRARREEYFAAAALASVVLGTHRAPSEKKTKPPNQSKSGSGRREKSGRRKKSFGQES